MELVGDRWPDALEDARRHCVQIRRGIAFEHPPTREQHGEKSPATALNCSGLNAREITATRGGQWSAAQVQAVFRRLGDTSFSKPCHATVTVSRQCHGTDMAGLERLLLGRVYVVDDDPSFLTSMERRLTKAGYVVATYPSAQELLDRVPSDTEPGCILLDVRIPGLSGPELQARLSELGSTLPIVFLTGHLDIPTTVRTIKAGADDFLTKPVSSTQLLNAVERAIAHHKGMRRSDSILEEFRAHLSTLTPREREVFALVTRGKTNKETARALGCSERTIKAHRQRVMEKLQVQTLAELVSLAERLGVFNGTSDQQISSLG